MKTPQDHFLAELADIYDAENRLAEALQKRSAAAVRQIRALDEVLVALGQTGECKAVALFLPSAGSTPKNGNPGLTDAVPGAAQSIEHPEIASYGGLRARATEPGNQTAAELPHSLPEKEESADQVLTGQSLARLQKPASGNEPREHKRGHLTVRPPGRRFPRSRGLRLARTGTHRAS
jgi:ferritin-like metal-binding protein YciE